MLKFIDLTARTVQALKAFINCLIKYTMYKIYQDLQCTV